MSIWVYGWPESFLFILFLIIIRGDEIEQKYKSGRSRQVLGKSP